MPSQSVNGCSFEADYEQSTTQNIKYNVGGGMMHFSKRGGLQLHKQQYTTRKREVVEVK